MDGIRLPGTKRRRFLDSAIHFAWSYNGSREVGRKVVEGFAAAHRNFARLSILSEQF